MFAKLADTAQVFQLDSPFSCVWFFIIIFIGAWENDYFKVSSVNRLFQTNPLHCNKVPYKLRYFYEWLLILFPSSGAHLFLPFFLWHIPYPPARARARSFHLSHSPSSYLGPGPSFLSPVLISSHLIDKWLGSLWAPLDSWPDSPIPSPTIPLHLIIRRLLSKQLM